VLLQIIFFYSKGNLLHHKKNRTQGEMSSWRRSLWRVDSSVGIGSRYWLDGPRIESQCVGARITTSVKTGPGAHPASCKMCTRSHCRCQNGWGVPLITHPPCIAEVKERVGIYPFPTSGLSWPVLGWNFPSKFAVVWVTNPRCLVKL
jgi:hypothetical protein